MSRPVPGAPRRAHREFLRAPPVHWPAPQAGRKATSNENCIHLCRGAHCRIARARPDHLSPNHSPTGRFVVPRCFVWVLPGTGPPEPLGLIALEPAGGRGRRRRPARREAGSAGLPCSLLNRTSSAHLTFENSRRQYSRRATRDPAPDVLRRMTRARWPDHTTLGNAWPPWCMIFASCPWLSRWAVHLSPTPWRCGRVLVYLGPSRDAASAIPPRSLSKRTRMAVHAHLQ